MAKKPLRISDDVNDLQTVEFGDTELAGVGGLDLDNLGSHLLQRSGNDMIFQDVAAGGPWTLTQLLEDTGSRDFSYSFFANNGVPYLQLNTITYSTIAEIYWGGSAEFGTIDDITAIIGSNNATQTAEVRVFDRTNGLVIAEVSYASLTRDIVDMGTISNVSTGPAIYEVQIKKTGGAARAQISSIVISTAGV